MTQPTDPDSFPTPPPSEPVRTYQELLDHALEETFPASDPIAPGGATRVETASIDTPRDAVDWPLVPGSTETDAPHPPDSR